MIDRTYSVLVNGTEYKIEVTPSGNGFRIRNSETEETHTASFRSLRNGLVSVEFNNRTFRIGMYRENGGVYEMSVDGRSYRVDVEEARFREEKKEHKLEQKEGLHPVKADIPGQVIELMVAEGDEIEKGETLLLLSAMKLENEVRAHESGTIKEVKIEEGDNVEKEELLIVIES